MQLTGHKSRSVFDRYSIVSERDLAENVAKLARLPSTPRKSLPFPGGTSGGHNWRSEAAEAYADDPARCCGGSV